MIAMLLRLMALVWISVSASFPAIAQSGEIGSEAGEDVALSPETLGDALSCRSHPAAGAFASALFLEDKTPEWMRKIADDKDTEGMIGLYGFRLSKPVLLMGEQVTTVYFLQDWVVTLWPRDKVAAFIATQKMARAPIKVTEQYYRFIDSESGPMLGAFEPTGGAISEMLAKAFGAQVPPSPASNSLFVGCNYTVASQADFLEAAAQSEAIVKGAAADISKAVAPPDTQ